MLNIREGSTMKPGTILVIFAILWMLFFITGIKLAYSADLDPQLEFGLGYPVHNNRDYHDGNVTGYIGASVRVYKWRFMDLRASAQHISDPTTNDAGTSWVGGVIRFGYD